MRQIKTAVFCISLLASLGTAAQDKAPERRAPDQYGRYVVTFSPFARADTFLVDTQTGKVWQLTKFSDLQGEPLVFKNLDRIDSDSQFEQWLKTQRFKELTPRQ